MQSPVFPDARILIVDDAEAGLRTMERLLHREGYSNVFTTTDSGRALTLFTELNPDLLILDLHMPFPDGFAILEHLSNRMPRSTFLPILALTGDLSAETKSRALVLGAKDFLTKPLTPLEARYRIKNLLQMRRLYLDLQERNTAMEAQVANRREELEQAGFEVLERLVRATDPPGEEAEPEPRSVREIAVQIGVLFGLSPEYLERLRQPESRRTA